MTIKYEAYVESYRMWGSRGETETGTFDTREEAERFVNRLIDKISDSSSDFVGDYGIKEISLQTDEK